VCYRQTTRTRMAHSDSASILILPGRRAYDGTRNGVEQCRQGSGRLLAASVQLAIIASAERIRFCRVDARSRIRWPWISIVSPSMTDARPIKSVAFAGTSEPTTTALVDVIAAFGPSAISAALWRVSMRTPSGTPKTCRTLPLASHKSVVYKIESWIQYPRLK
jgi:hypothetical protein